jgi:hypothetical protein
MLVDPMQVVGDDAKLHVLRGCGFFQIGDTRACRLRAGGRTASRGFRLVRTMYPPTSGHESTASRHAP